MNHFCCVFFWGGGVDECILRLSFAQHNKALLHRADWQSLKFSSNCDQMYDWNFLFSKKKFLVPFPDNVNVIQNFASGGSKKVTQGRNRKLAGKRSMIKFTNFGRNLSQSLVHGNSRKIYFLFPRLPRQVIEPGTFCLINLFQSHL
jgi:hypothetical protein